MTHSSCEHHCTTRTCYEKHQGNCCVDHIITDTSPWATTHVCRPNCKDDYSRGFKDGFESGKNQPTYYHWYPHQYWSPDTAAVPKFTYNTNTAGVSSGGTNTLTVGDGTWSSTSKGGWNSNGMWVNSTPSNESTSATTTSCNV